MKNGKLKIWRGFTLRSVATKGFTLIELLVVISIIGILAGLTLTGFNAARKNARDTQRKSDLQQYRSALEAYASNNKSYPNNTENGSSCSNNGIFQDDGVGTAGPIINEYLPAIIRDPVENCAGGAPCEGGQCVYRYWASGDGTIYKLLGQLETGGFWEICSNGKAGKGTWTGNETCTVP